MPDTSKLDNFVAIVDNNGLQIDGKIDDVCSPYPIEDKFKAFNFHVINVDAHDFDALRKAFDEAKADQRNANCHYCKEYQRKRRFFHGKSGKLAW